MSMQQNRHGFTLLEVLVSATIIAVLTAVGVVSYSSVNRRSRDVKRKSDLEQIRSALEMYRSDVGQYPSIAGSMSDAQGLSGDLVSTYMPAIPSDPNESNVYYYQAISSNGLYTSYCLCAGLETITTTQNTCTISLPGACNYGLKSP